MLDNRPSKKQQELFLYIKAFIGEHGYGPSYREVMRALDYKSVSTVAVHVDGLITRGLLRKKDHSARSLEVVGIPTTTHAQMPLDWLAVEAQKRLEKLQKLNSDQQLRHDVVTLIEALAILGATEAAQKLKEQVGTLRS